MDKYIKKYTTQVSNQQSTGTSLVHDVRAGPSTSVFPMENSDGTLGATSVDKKCKSLIWNHFARIENGEGSKKASMCNYCSTVIKIDYGNTSSMARHLQAKHTDIYKKFDIQRKENENKPKKQKTEYQTTITDAIKVSEKAKWSSEHPKAKALTNAVGHWMAASLHPYSLVEEDGFRNVMKLAEPNYVVPSATTFSRRIIPSLVEELKKEIKDIISKEKNKLASVSFTTDMWTSGNNMSYIAITCHFVLDDSFTIESVCLGQYYFEGQHTGNNIRQKIEQCMEEWDLLDLNVPTYIITDNARNFVSAVDKTMAVGLTCFAHSLQLTIKDAKNCKIANVGNMLSKARAIVGHFKHSSQDTDKLMKKQTEMGLEPRNVIQDVETRWNSEYSMLRRLLELKGPLSLVLLEIGKVDNLTTQDWQAAENYVEILEPLAKATEDVSGNRLPTRSMIIPILCEIQEHLQTYVENHPGTVGVGFAKSLLHSLKSRFPLYVQNNSTDVMCTLVDPRFKDVFLQKPDQLLAEEMLKKHVQTSNSLKGKHTFYLCCLKKSRPMGRPFSQEGKRKRV